MYVYIYIYMYGPPNQAVPSPCLCAHVCVCGTKAFNLF